MGGDRECITDQKRQVGNSGAATTQARAVVSTGDPLGGQKDGRGEDRSWLSDIVVLQDSAHLLFDVKARVTIAVSSSFYTTKSSGCALPPPSTHSPHFCSFTRPHDLD